MSAVADFLKAQGMFRCERMNASITRKQCDINRNGQAAGPNRMAIRACLSCEGCPGLGSEITELKEALVAQKICSVVGCEKSVHARGMCWAHERSVLGVNPATGLPLVKVKTNENAAGPVRISSPVTVCERIITADDVKAMSGGKSAEKDSAMAREIDSLFAAKRAEWLDDLAGATTERSRAKMFLSMADVLEGLVY